MSIHLVGGGASPDSAGALFGEFIAEAAARAARVNRLVPRIAVLLVDGQETSPAAYATRYTELLRGVAPCEPVVTFLLEGDRATSALLSNVDALLVGGGPTPAYLEAVIPLVDEIRLLVADGLPYLGFSAGAAIAADTAIIGGWKIDGIPIGHENISEDLDEVTVVGGLGLIDLAVDTHAAQWGTLARLIAATEAGLVDGGIAIDEDTVLVIGEGELHIAGAGNIWRVTPADDGVLVTTIGAETDHG